MTAEADWEALAWILWRRRRLTWRQVSNHLAVEGWCVPPPEVARVLLERVRREMNAATVRADLRRKVVSDERRQNARR
jgi:hypothetical protein